jgi:hypothetical protein
MGKGRAKKDLLQAALTFGGAGLVIGLPITLSSGGTGWHTLGVCAGVAAGVSGVLVWRLIFPGSRAYTLWKGVVAGVFTAMLSYPLCWYLAIILTYYSGQTDSLGQRTLHPMAASSIKGILGLSLISALITGWITIPVAALAGGVLAVVQARKTG